MDSSITVALALTALFFGCIIWLVIHARRQARPPVALGQQEAEPPEARTKKRVA
jgi:hypothetical protein